MKQTVEEAAEKCRRTTAQSMGVYAQYHSIDECHNHGITYDEIAEAAFIKGAEWQAKQSPWISVKEKAGCDSSNDCIVMDTDGEVFRACFSPENKWLKYNRGYYVIDNVTHWMPIPSLNENP